MLREIICAAFFLALILAPALEKTSREMSVREPVEIRHTAIESASNSVYPLQFSQSLAPFGRYIENINGVALELVRMPQGTFLMGNNHSPNPEEKPAHQVNIRSFYLGQYEITRKQWNIVADTLPQISRRLARQFVDPAISQNFQETTPADAIYWDDAVEFCERLTRFTGHQYRLPSEAEWEYACRARTQTEFSFGDRVDYKLAHFRDITADYSPSYWILPVGAKGYANAWGLFDMHGNVAEWCLDVEHPDYTGAPTDGSAWLQGGDQSRRCQRGGAYGFKDKFGRSSARLFWSRSVTISEFGFRVVAEISSPTNTAQVTAISAASYSGTALAAESIAALFGSNLSSDPQTASVLPLPTILGGTSVVLKDSRGNEYASPLFFTSPNQINFQLLPDLTPGPATVSVVTNGNIHSTGILEITSINPGLFTADASGNGLAAALILRVKGSGEQVYEPVAGFDSATGRFVAVPIDVSDPAEEVFLLLFGTGIRHRNSLAEVRVTAGGQNAEVLFAGAQGDFVGLDQVNLRLPHSLAGRGEVDVVLIVDGKAANPVKVHFR
jgi:uncharacterized protein (TIGR03437 family)